MSPMTTGAFLAEKVRNMQVWAAELLSPKDVILRQKLLDKSVSELEAVALATALLGKKSVIEKRDWVGVRAMLDEAGSAPDVVFWCQLMEGLAHNPMAQDKFWRYLDLFVTAVDGK